MESYFKNAIPEKFRILGRKMKDLSLGHYCLLKRFDCAFVAEGEARATGADLIIGVLICSMTVDEFIAFADSRDFAKEVRRWSGKIAPKPWLAKIPWLGKWWRKHFGFDLYEKVGLFKAYITNNSVVPKFWDESENGQPSGSHWAHSIEVILRGELGWSRNEINTAPLSKALADYFKFAESRGSIRFMTDWEIELIEAAEKAEREEARKREPIFDSLTLSFHAP